MKIQLWAVREEIGTIKTTEQIMQAADIASFMTELLFFIDFSIFERIFNTSHRVYEAAARIMAL